MEPPTDGRTTNGDPLLIFNRSIMDLLDVPLRVPVILVQQSDESGNAKVKNVLPNWVMTTPFMRGGRGAMHVKVGLREQYVQSTDIHEP